MRIIAAIFILISALFLITTCCNDCPICPKPETTQYRLYAVDDYGHRLYAIDIPADTVLFSVPVDFETALDMFVSQDGSRLMISVLGVYSTLIYDTRDLSVIDTLDDMYGYYYFDYSDNYGVLVSGLIADPVVKILDPNTLESHVIINRFMRYAFLDTVSNCLYGVAGPDANLANLVYKIDCYSERLTDSFFIATNDDQFVSVGNIAYNWLNDILYFHARIAPSQSYFYQYDLFADSALDSTYIVEKFGSVAISPNGRRVYMTEGGNAWFGIRPPGYIRDYDALTHKADSIFLPDIDPYDQPWEPYYRDILITPDGKRAYIGAGGSDATWAPLSLFSINLDDNTVNIGAMPTSTFSASVIAIGPAP